MRSLIERAREARRADDDRRKRESRDHYRRWRESAVKYVNAVLDTTLSWDDLGHDMEFEMDGLSFHVSSWTSGQLGGGSGWFLYVKLARGGSHRVGSLPDLARLIDAYGLSA